jgi:hypothetical protein
VAAVATTTTFHAAVPERRDEVPLCEAAGTLKERIYALPDASAASG